MKTYTVATSSGTHYTFAGFVDGIKETLEDTVQAAERSKLFRQFKKGLLAAEVYAADRESVQAMSFDSQAVVKYCTATRAGQRHVIRLLLEAGGKLREVSEADIDAVHADYLDTASEIHQTFLRIWDDAFPKPTRGASAPQVLTAEPDGINGEPSSATTPSGSPMTNAAG